MQTYQLVAHSAPSEVGREHEEGGEEGHQGGGCDSVAELTAPGVGGVVGVGGVGGW